MPQEQSKIDSSKKLGNIGYTRPKTKKAKNTTQYVFDTTICKQTQTNVNKSWAFLQTTESKYI